MAIGVLLLVATALGAYGYFRGAIRLFLALLPLALATSLLWLLGSMFYRIATLRNAGLVWPALGPVLIGAAGGYVLQFLARKRLPDKVHKADRIAGSVIGMLFALLVVWAGCVYAAMWSASRHGEVSHGSAGRLAHVLDAAFLRWIPMVGSGSTAMMGLLEISTADEEVRQRVLRELGLDHLLDVPEVRDVVEDSQTREDVDAAARGSMSALWRLQSSSKILRLLESKEVGEAIKEHSLADVVEAVRRSRRDAAQRR